MDLEYFIGALVVRRGQSGARAALVQEDSNRCFFLQVRKRQNSTKFKV